MKNNTKNMVNMVNNSFTPHEYPVNIGNSNIRSNNLSTNTLFNTTLFTPEVKYRIQNWFIPGVRIDHPEMFTQVGQINMQGSQLAYNPLNITILADENLNVFEEILSTLQKYQIPGTNTFSCDAHYLGQAWVEIYDSKNNYLFKLEFHNCYLKTMNDINYMTNDDNEVVTIQIELVYDYYKINRNS